MTLAELLSVAENLQNKISDGWQCLNPNQITSEISELQKEANNPHLWNDADNARKVTQRLASLQKKQELWKTLISESTELLELIQMTNEEDTEIVDLEKEYEILQQKFTSAETDLYLSGEYDDRGAIVEIASGAGGAEAQDFAEMLLRMELRFAERMGWKAEILEKSENSEAGIKSATLEITGENAFGYLQGEKGTHRLVRLSPFNAKNLRHTSFAGIAVSPLLEERDTKDIVLEEKDLRIDTFRAQGAGGQHVNKTDSAIRITHVPTSIVVSCQSSRSQHQNKDKALQILKSRLTEERHLEEARKQAELKGEHISAEWGSQIRNYVLHPYKLVKDLRTEYESTNPDDVLDGNLEPFVKKYLAWKAMQKNFK